MQSYQVDIVEETSTYIKLVGTEHTRYKRLEAIYIIRTKELKVRAYSPYWHLFPLIRGMKKFLKYKNLDVVEVTYT